ncbi:hypothetical protein [Streptomyces sp. NPDC058583]|uniref:hypothetical protein n=1 Tax=unclassified Streptomyces TaxID=2593676 RepID=UPI00365BE36B
MNERQFIADNPLNRYAICDRSGMRTDPDGGRWAACVPDETGAARSLRRPGRRCSGRSATDRRAEQG